jgi:hypothetical protein
VFCDSFVPARRGGRVAVASGDVRTTPAGEVAVDDIVVHDERRVQQFKGGTDIRGGLDVGSAEGLVRRHDHTRPEALTPGGVGLESLPQGDVLHTERRCAVLG